MHLIDPIIHEYNHEMGVTRKFLARVPNDRWDWRPHPKSMTFGQLASHLAEAQRWVPEIMHKDVFLLDMSAYQPYIGENCDAVVAEFDKQITAAARSMQGASDDSLMRNWTMKTPDGTTMIEMPRIAVLRTFVLNHAIHHRAQLGLYLRMNDVAVPQTYGPTADER